MVFASYSICVEIVIANAICVMYNIVFFNDSNKLLSAVYCLTGLSKHFNCIGTFNNDTVKLSECVIDLRPNILALGLEHFLTEGLSVLPLVSTYYKDIKVIIDKNYIKCLESLEQQFCALEKDILYIASTEQVLRILLREQKNNFIISPYAYDNIVDYYNLDLQHNQTLALTPTEKNVLKLLSDGKSYKLIACELNVAYETIKSHIQNIYKKLEVNNSSGAVSKAIKYKLIE